MNDESKNASSRRHRWITFLATVILTSVLLTLLLQVASHFGAKAWVERLSETTWNALHDLTSLNMAKHFIAVFKEQQWGACEKLAGKEFSDCMARHPAPTGPMLAVSAFHAMFTLIRETLRETPLQAVFDIMQLIAGFVAMTRILIATKVQQYALTFPVVLSIVPLWILCSCALSFVAIFLVYLVTLIAGEVLPQAGTCLFCGCWTGFVLQFSGRATEAGLHHPISHLVERFLSRTASNAVR